MARDFALKTVIVCPGGACQPGGPVLGPPCEFVDLPRRLHCQRDGDLDMPLGW